MDYIEYIDDFDDDDFDDDDIDVGTREVTVEGVDDDLHCSGLRLGNSGRGS